MSILGTLLGRREPVVEFRTVDGGHPAPFPDMTDEQLYNWEVTFNVPNRTFKEPPRSVRPPDPRQPRKEPPLRREPFTETVTRKTQEHTRTAADDEPEQTATVHRHTHSMPPAYTRDLPPLDLTRPVRLVTTKQPVEIITTRARHPVYKVHGYIGDDDVVTVFTLEGQLSENGPRYLENIPQKQQVFLNVYRNREANAAEQYVLTQHASRAQADAAAKPDRIACVPLQFDV